jgi:predicted GNAT superfamily acetyltransferase
VACDPCTYTEWRKSAQYEESHLNGARRAQTFAALGEEHHPVKVVPCSEQQQRGIRILPFTYDTFRDICNAFDVHESFTKALTRTDVPSFSCEKVDMGYATYGKPLVR